MELLKGKRVRINTPDLWFHDCVGTITVIDAGIALSADRNVGCVAVQIDNYSYLCRFNPEELIEE